MGQLNGDLATAVAEASASMDADALRRQFVIDDEFVALPRFLPEHCLDPILRRLPDLESAAHRNFLPGLKKGGSIGRHVLDELVPELGVLYRSRPLHAFVESICASTVMGCPPRDRHGYALYLYTEPGDHIGWHYDTSFYRGRRYTLLLGLVDRSRCVLECELHRKTRGRKPKSRRIRLEPGTVVLFNGDRIYHRVTPLDSDGLRICLAMELVTDPRMNPIARIVSDVKDVFGYFGFRGLLTRPSLRPSAEDPSGG